MCRQRKAWLNLPVWIQAARRTGKTGRTGHQDPQSRPSMLVGNYKLQGLECKSVQPSQKEVKNRTTI